MTTPTTHVELSINPTCPIPLDKLRFDWQEFFNRRQRLDTDLGDAPNDLLASFGGHMTVDGDTSAPLDIIVHVYVLSDEEMAVEELEPTGGDDEWTAACDSLALPHKNLQGLWESLIFDGTVQQDLISFARSALLFSDRAVASHIVHWNRLCLLHGPPGTGKTSLCRALAHKLSIRLNDRFSRATLLEIHSHSLFSKWFSTSGKLVHRLFELVRDMVEDDPDCLVFVLIDEIESLAGSRGNLGGEPSDALRAVNSLLTSLDRLRSYANVLVLATTNLKASVDAAFIDRADVKLYIGLPCLAARYEILRSGVAELTRVGIVADDASSLPAFNEVDEAMTTEKNELMTLARMAEGLSGRSLRRLPLQAHARLSRKSSASLSDYLSALKGAIEAELQAATMMKG